jgi:predicted DCC family thiol-disulfide oxidoreductase YuxK
MEWLSKRDRDQHQHQPNNNGSSSPKLRLTDIESENYDPTDPANGGISYEEGMAAMCAITPDGTVVKGVPVFRMAYQQVGLGWLFAITSWPVFQTLFDAGYDVFAKYRTQVTRGSRMEDLIQVYREKKALETRQQADDCEVCQTKDEKQE